MSQELHYTSVSRGLNPGSRGFCTVACTPEMPGPLVERLESLSGYQPVYPVNDPAADQNPINFSHLKLTIRGNSLSVLSRIGPAELDYSGRSNKYAHHVVLETSERPEGGPAWSLSQRGFLQESWEGEPRVLSEGRRPKPGDRPGGFAHAWQALIGDPGWAGVLAESFLADPKRTAFLIFQPGMDLLPLFVEAMALLPPHRRWDVEFSTYFTTLPQGVTCHWRCVLEGSPEANNALRLPNTLVISLGNPAGRAEGRALVHQARTGERPESPVVDPAASAPGGPRKPATSGAGRPPVPMNPSRGRPPSPPTHSERFPELEAGGTNQGSRLSDRPTGTRRRQGRTWALIAGICTVCLVAMAGMALVLYPDSQRPEPVAAKTKDAAPVDSVVKVDEARAPSNDKAPNKTPVETAAQQGTNVAHEPASNPSPATAAEKQDTSVAAKPKEKTASEVKTDLVVKQSPPDDSQPQAKSPNKDVRLRFFDLPEPKSGLSFFDASTAPGSPKLDLPNSGASKLQLIDLPKATNTNKPNSGLAGRPVAKGESDGINGKDHALARFTLKGGKVQFELKAREVANGGLHVMVGRTDGTDAKEHTLARFTLKEGKVHFEWDADPWSGGNSEFRDQLRNRVLKITVKDGETLYSLLRKRPDAITGPVKIRPTTTSRRRISENSDPLVNFTSVKNKPERSTFIKWFDTKQETEYAFLKKNIVILSVESSLPSSNEKRFLKKDGENFEWGCEGNSELVFKFSNERNQIQFTFDGSVPIPQDTTVIDQILDAPYNVVLGLRVDDGQIVEMARIGSPPPPKNDVAPTKKEATPPKKQITPPKADRLF